MNWLRPLGSTGLEVSAIGLGTVKLGRDRGVKYPAAFTIPDTRAARDLLAQARDLGINLIDTAPAYGDSELRLGELLRGQRNHWVLCSKVGEEFEGGRSLFDFSPRHTRGSVRRSLQRLETDVLDLVLVHSDGDDLRIIKECGTLETLQDLKREGLIRAFGMSTKTPAGGLAAAKLCDVVMLTSRLKRGALVKKALASGHLAEDYPDPVQASMDLVLSHPGTSAAVIGTIDPAHLRDNVAAARNALT
ncbi:MAG: aldo/keto reductase [Haliea sp.]|nr:aldo/keto reductase [Haliea sp.]